MNIPTPSTAEQVSALADGQLQGAAVEQVLQACERDPGLLERWRDYHLIGDALRGVPSLGSADEAGFVARLRSALTQEASLPDTESSDFAQVRVAPLRGQAANEPRFRWGWAASFAFAALLAGLVWTLSGEGSEDDVFLASGDSPLLVAGSQGVVMRDPDLEELIEAHRQQGGASVLPMPSGFLRNATFEASPAAVTRTGSPSRR